MNSLFIPHNREREGLIDGGGGCGKPGLFNFLLKPAGVNKDAAVRRDTRSVKPHTRSSPRLVSSVDRGTNKRIYIYIYIEVRKWDKRRERKRVGGL